MEAERLYITHTKCCKHYFGKMERIPTTGPAISYDGLNGVFRYVAPVRMFERDPGIMGEFILGQAPCLYCGKGAE